MMHLTGRMALAAMLAAAIPIAAAQAQDPKAKHGAAARPAAPAARHAAPAARPAAPRAVPQVSAPRVAPRIAPQAARPQVARPRVAAPHIARPSAPNAGRPHVAAPRVSPQRAGTLSQQSPAVVNRNVQRRQSPAVVNRNVERQQSRATRQRERQQAPSAQAKTSPQAAKGSTQAQSQAQSNVQIQRQQRIERRQQLRAERTLRNREDRELRNLPAAQRAQRREEIRNARQQRTLDRRQLAQPGAAQTESNARIQRANRRNGEARLTREAARRGRFAAPFAAQGAHLKGQHRFARLAAHRAWRHGHRAAFVAWYGPVFWPYAYSDIFDYTFWPYGYDDGYWAYVYDDFFDGVFWGEYGPPEDYAYAEPAPRASTQRPSYAAVRDLCRQPGSGVTAWPFADIERKVGLNAEQKDLLREIRKASDDAAATFKASCPPDDTFPLTPPGRLAAMTARLDATLQAVQTVRPALENFYASLNDEQKERFNEIGPKRTAANAEAREASQAADSCKQPKPGLANLPIEKIEDVINPTDAQANELNRLQDATGKAVEIMQAACPDETPLTPPGRLDAMEKRLQSMIDAANTVKPALESFFASLTSEQKARFNRIGQQLSQANG
jgi:hypothetical protein